MLARRWTRDGHLVFVSLKNSTQSTKLRFTIRVQRIKEADENGKKIVVKQAVLSVNFVSAMATSKKVRESILEEIAMDPDAVLASMTEEEKAQAVRGMF